MSPRPWRCDCGAKFATFRALQSHQLAPCAVRSARRARDAAAGAGKPSKKRGVTVAHTLPADWRGDLDQPSLDIDGLVPLIVPGSSR